MRKFTSRIKLIFVLITVVAISDIFDDYFLILLKIKNNGIGEIIYDTCISVLYILLVFWAFSSGRKMLMQYKKEKKHFQHLIDLSPEAIYVHREGNIVFANQAGVTLLAARDMDQLLNQNWKELIHFENYNYEQFLIEEFKDDTNQILNHQIKAKRLDGKVIDLEFTSTKVEYEGMPAREVIARDITFRKQQDSILEQLAYQDALTGLPNRRAFLNQLEQLVVNSKQNTFSIIFIDLDGFKKVNDILGHEAGDDLLKKASNIFKNCVRERDTVARLAGDEFTILLPETNQQESIEIADKIIEVMYFSIPSKNIYVTASIGIALYPQDGEDVYTLLKKADIAMYQAKHKGKNRYQLVNHCI